MASVEAGPTTTFVGREIQLTRPKLVVLSGPQQGVEHLLKLGESRITVGSAASCGIVIDGLADVHVELEVGSGVRVIDRSGGQTTIAGHPIQDAVLERGATLSLGAVEVRLQDGTDRISVLPSRSEVFHLAKGRSLAMREVFGVLEAIADTEATVLLLGETGTGKDVLARSIHAASSRRDGPITTVDCGAIAPSLVESELFGYERGAFTGADETREGAFERTQGGTLFLDEIGELPLDVQPKLLRAIDEREIQRVGSGDRRPIDVRIVAATKRDLLVEVEKGRFREDLYFRLAIVPIHLPSLRDRREDIPLLVEAFRESFKTKHGRAAEFDPNEVNSLLAHDWPGNVRELKNTVERALWLAQTGEEDVARFMLPTAESLSESLTGDLMPQGEAPPEFDSEVSFSEHKQAWEAKFEKTYLSWLFARADGSISKAARLGSMDRKHLRGLLRKHGIVET